MTNTDNYIEDQIFFSYLNKSLILKDPNEIMKDLLNQYEINQAIDLIITYLEISENICFISYFNLERQKLIHLLQMLIFTKKRSLKFSDCLEEYLLYEEIIKQLIDSLKYLENIDSSKKEQYETILLSYRNISKVENAELYLKICYIVDEDLIKYINGKTEKIELTANNYKFYYFSLLYYYHTIILTLEKREAFERIKKIIFYKYDGLKEERVKLLFLINKMLKMDYVDLEYDKLCADLYKKQHPEIIKVKKTNNIISMSKYKKDE